MRAIGPSLSSFVVRAAAPFAAAFLLAGQCAPATAQPAAKPPVEVRPCPLDAPERGDEQRPCGGPAEGGAPGAIGAGGGGAPGSGGGGGSNPAAPVQALGPYRVVKVMDRAGETVDGVVCALDRPFIVHMHTRPATFDIAFEPADSAHGTWTYTYDIPRAGESHKASGEHAVSAPAADGSRTLTIDGKDFVTFKGFAGPMPMKYVIGLAPLAGDSGCGR
jgi:hypothetical protein